MLEEDNIVMKKEYMGLIVKNDDGSEIINYDDPTFPSYIYYGWVAPKVTWAHVPHFHEDIEILTVTEGTMAYSVNGKTLVLNEGDTIVVNSNQIHYSMCVDDTVARYVIFVVHPRILASTVKVEMEAVKPIIDNPDISYIRYRNINEGTERLYDLMMELPDIRHDAFKVTRQFMLIWEIIMDTCESFCSINEEQAADSGRKPFKQMMNFIANNYKEKITLDQVASSANISKSHCINMFKRYVDESPMNYLAHFRARKCAEYLRSTDMNMEEISSETGFGGASYMAETFRKFFGKSPREYRSEWKNPPDVQPDLNE